MCLSFSLVLLYIQDRLINHVFEVRSVIFVFFLSNENNFINQKQYVLQLLLTGERVKIMQIHICLFGG